jgi:hypothetical protein
VNIEITSAGYDAARDCPNEACVVAQVQEDAAIVRDKAPALPIRAEALRGVDPPLIDIEFRYVAADGKMALRKLLNVPLPP